MKKFLGVIFALLAGIASAAPVSAPTAFDRFMSQVTGAGKQTVSFGTNGAPLLSPGVPTIETDGGALARVNASGSFQNPSGTPVATTASGRIPAAKASAAIGKALVKVASGLSGLSAGLAVGSALYDLVRELNYDASANPDGTIKVTKLDPASCTVAPCYQYTPAYFLVNQMIYGTPSTSIAVACQGLIGKSVSGWTINSSTPLNTSSCSISGTGPSGQAWSDTATSNVVQVAPSAPTYIPSSIEELQNQIALKSGWPATSNLSRALVDASTVNSEHLPVEQVSVTGPASSTGSTSTKVKPDGTTDTVTTVHSHTYNGDTINTTTITTTNNYNPTTNTTTTTETVSGPAPERPKDIETCGMPGKPACKIDETGTPADPRLNPATRTTDVFKPISDFVANPRAALPSLPTINWTFQLPTGCAAIALPAFSPWLQSIDVCQFQPMFHEVMNIVWVMGAVFGMIGTFWRSVFSQGG